MVLMTTWGYSPQEGISTSVELSDPGFFLRVSTPVFWIRVSRPDTESILIGIQRTQKAVGKVYLFLSSTFFPPVITQVFPGVVIGIWCLDIIFIHRVSSDGHGMAYGAFWPFSCRSYKFSCRKAIELELLVAIPGISVLGAMVFRTSLKITRNYFSNDLVN